MAASLDGFIARKDGRVDWLETADEFVGGDTMAPGFIEAFLLEAVWSPPNAFVSDWPTR